MPVFVVDAYTKRIFIWYGLVAPDAGYAGMQAFFTANLPQDVPLYNDFHAQIVHLGNAVCKTTPDSSGCPISKTGDKQRCQACKWL